MNDDDYILRHESRAGWALLLLSSFFFLVRAAFCLDRIWETKRREKASTKIQTQTQTL